MRSDSTSDKRDGNSTQASKMTKVLPPGESGWPSMTIWRFCFC